MGSRAVRNLVVTLAFIQAGISSRQASGVRSYILKFGSWHKTAKGIVIQGKFMLAM